MSFLQELIAKASEGVKGLFEPKELISPLATPKPPTMNIIQTQQSVGRAPTAPEVPYRNPMWDKWKTQNPKGFEELLSGTGIASSNYGVPQDLLMDIAGIESSGGQFMDQLSGGPGKGYFQFENPEAGYDPYSATSSANLAARRIKNKQLSNWGYGAEDQIAREGRNWGSVDNPDNSNGKLSELYQLAELNKFLTDQYQLR